MRFPCTFEKPFIRPLSLFVYRIHYPLPMLKHIRVSGLRVETYNSSYQADLQQINQKKQLN